MKTLKIIGMVPLVLISATAFGQGSDDRAVPRAGGGSSSSDSGSRHTGGSSSGSSASSNSSGSSGSSAQSGGSQYNDSTPDAARRRPRPGTGTGDRGRYGNDGDRYTGYPNSYYYYDPYAYSWGYPGRSYGRYGYGYGYGYNDYGYSYGDYYGYYPSSSYRSYRYRSGNIAQLRTLVEPAKARVYVDGYYAGIVDDFDGLLQRLNVSPGRHDITFKLGGYSSHTFSIYANRDQTLKLRFDMAKGSGETRDSIGEEYDRRSDRIPDRDLDLDRDSARETADRSREVDADQADRRYVPPSSDTKGGDVLLDIEPADASVYVDGEFYGKASQVTRLELPAGRHRIEIVRPGYRTEETEVEVTVEAEAKRVVVKLVRR